MDVILKVGWETFRMEHLMPKRVLPNAGGLQIYVKTSRLWHDLLKKNRKRKGISC